jgi:hypothetical protein
MAQIARLKDAEISNGNIINADDLDAEFNQLVSESNGQDTRLTTIESGAFSKSGVMTFLATPKMDAISEVTAAAGVTIDSVVCKDGMVTVAGTPTTNGQIGYASNVLNAYINGSLKTIATTDAIINDFEYLGTSGAISAASTVDFTTAGWFNGTYTDLEFRLIHVKPTTDNTVIWLRTSVGGTFLSTNEYDYVNNGRSNTDTARTLSAASQAQLIPLVNNNLGNGTNENYCGRIRFSAPNATLWKMLDWQYTYSDLNTAIINASGGGAVKTTSAIDGVRFLMSSGTIASGEIKVYGLRAS